MVALSLATLRSLFFDPSALFALCDISRTLCDDEVISSSLSFGSDFFVEYIEGGITNLAVPSF